MLTFIAALFIGGWTLMMGPGQAPEDFVADHPECEYMAIYGFLGDSVPRWERYLTDVPDWVNTIEVMSEDKVYWVYCGE